MKLLFLGDVVGRSGRTAIAEALPRLRREWALDFVVVNGENATGGMGLSGAHAALLFEAGADCVTLGDHAFDQRDMMAFIEEEARIIRPLNFARAAPGRGARFFDAPGGRRVFVAQVLGQAFMKRPFDDPFSAIEAALKPATLGGTAAGGDRRGACRGDLGEDGAGALVRRAGEPGGGDPHPRADGRHPDPRRAARPIRATPACAATTTA